jgi:hypothetical protein
MIENFRPHNQGNNLQCLYKIGGTEFATIKFNIADDLSRWSAELPGKVLAKAEALT